MKKLAIAVICLCCAQNLTAAPNMAWRQVIPASASTEGAESSFWRTDLSIYNPGDRAANIALELVPPAGTFNFWDWQEPYRPGVVNLPGLLEPNQTLTIADVLGTHFLQAYPDLTVGAIVVVARDGDGEPVDVVTFSRTWTPTSDGDGTYGQGIPGVPWVKDGDLSTHDRVLSGLESSDEFRSNLGLVNLSPYYEEIFGVELLDAGGASLGVRYYTLSPRELLQINNVLDRFDAHGSGFTAVVRLVDWTDLVGLEGRPTPDFVSYASRIDRTTNDPVYISEQSDERRIGYERFQLVPVVASTEGAEGSTWRTDLTIHYGGDEAFVVAVVELVPSHGFELDGDPPRFITTLGSGRAVTIEDVLGSRFPDHQVAALLVYAFGSNEDLVVSTRTWTPSESGDGTLGQGIPGVSLIAGDDPQTIAGLASGDSFRSNLGIVNPSRNLREHFEIEVLDAAGGSQGVVELTLEPWTHHQVNGILDDLELQGSGFTAVVRMVGSDNLMLAPNESLDPFFASYGSVVDSVTNDPTYVDGAALTRAPEPGGGDWYDFTAEAPWYLCPEDELPEEATVVSAFDRAYHYFGSEVRRSISQEVVFPESDDWNQVGLLLTLECPASGDCDDWDRTGSLQMLLNPEDPEEDWEYLEIIRHITPYNRGMCEYVDVTALAPLLTGTRTLESWIDTWVGPGHSAGEGWRISFDFVFYPGEPRQPDEVVNIWGRRTITLGYLDPDRNLASQIDPVDVTIPEDASKVELRLITTGHSFGNTDNCAEFCPLRQDVFVNDGAASVQPWRSDCELNPHSPQDGTWRYDRNGWCPGAVVVGQTLDITDMVIPGGSNTIGFDVRKPDGEEYENTVPGQYEPIEWISMQVFVYR